MPMPTQRSIVRPQVVNHSLYNYPGPNRCDQNSNAALVHKDHQKQLIGERLFPKVSGLVSPENVAKITGMMLEMDNPELLHLLENDQLLSVKIKEANAVLERAKATSQAV
ncbi:hypothetical protein FO519_004192 [Halicephalobus sp. NKZ332]|nr:hypothetical protein FO519_004192 [Halicephalobus sp. NKZ332]